MLSQVAPRERARLLIGLPAVPSRGRVFVCMPEEDQLEVLGIMKKDARAETLEVLAM